MIQRLLLSSCRSCWPSSSAARSASSRSPFAYPAAILYRPLAGAPFSIEFLSTIAEKPTTTTGGRNGLSTPPKQQQRQSPRSNIHKKQESWESMLQQLQFFVDENGHARVPEKWSPNPALARWIAYHRTKFRAGMLDSSEIQQLNQVGMVWDPYQDDWNERYCQLVDFHRKHGHSLVSSKSAQHAALGQWVVGQRYQYRLLQEEHKASHMTPERIKLLNDIEFEWEPQEAVWNSHYQELCLFHREFGHCLVPREYNVELYRWVEMNRYQYKRYMQDKHPSSMTSERIQLLNKIDFVWNARDALWYERLSELKEFVHVNGPGTMPPIKTHKSLRHWLSRQVRLFEEKQQGKSVSLTDARTVALKRLGFLL